MIAFCLNFLSEAFKTLMRVMISVFLAFEKMVYDAYLTFFSKAAILVLTFGVIEIRFNFISLFAVCSIGNALGFLLSVFILCKHFFRPTIALSGSQLKYLWVESFPMGVNKISQQIYFYIGVFVLKILGDNVAIALFQGPNKLITSFQIIPVAVMTALQPLMSRLGGSRVSSDFEAIYKASFKILVILGLPLATLGPLLSGKIVSIVFGEALRDGTPTLQILFVAVVFIFLDTLMTVVLTSIDRQGLLIIGNVVCIITNLAASLLLVNAYGYIGAAWSALLSYLVLFLTDFYFVTKHLKTVPTREGIGQALTGCLIAGSILYVLLSLNIVFLLLGGCFVYFGTLIVLKAFSSEEIQMFRRAWSSRTGTALKDP
jgi:O-antigen/teichoic acid export membrane protein